MNAPQAPAWFVAGTDTEVGKTFVTCALLHAFAAQGLNAVGMKPIAAGTDADGLHAARLHDSITYAILAMDVYAFGEGAAAL